MKTAEKERITIHNSLIMVTNAAFSGCTSWGMKQTKMLNAERERGKERKEKGKETHRTGKSCKNANRNCEYEDGKTTKSIWTALTSYSLLFFILFFIFQRIRCSIYGRQGMRMHKQVKHTPSQTTSTHLHIEHEYIISKMIDMLVTIIFMHFETGECEHSTTFRNRIHLRK